MLRLDFTYADLDLPLTRRTTQRASISGCQDKVQLKRTCGRFEIVDRGGDYILKPVPRYTAARLAEDIPANEALTMDLASKFFNLRTARHELVELADGSPAYLTQRFDYRDGQKIRQEDFCQLSGRSEETHGDNYKYDASYEELAQLIVRYCPSAAIESPKAFAVILFNYVFSNGDAHLKNFSLYESPQGDLILTPAYDLLDTAVHFHNEPSATGLDFFADGHFTPRYEVLGFYSSADFLELGKCFGVDEAEVKSLIVQYDQQREKVLAAIADSHLSPAARERYRAHFLDRLKAIKQ